MRLSQHFTIRLRVVAVEFKGVAKIGERFVELEEVQVGDAPVLENIGVLGRQPNRRVEVGRTP